MQAHTLAALMGTLSLHAGPGLDVAESGPFTLSDPREWPAVEAPFAHASARVAPPATSTLVRHESGILARALGGPVLQLTMRGTTVPVTASATPLDDGCAARLTASAPAGGAPWTRLLRWNEVAWSGTGAGGRTTVVFYDPQGRLAADRLAFAPGNAEAFRTALARVVSACRSASGENRRVLVESRVRTRSCYFPRAPQLQLYDSPATSAGMFPRRAVVTVLSRENPEAELQLIFERGEPRADTGGGVQEEWTRATVSFIYADGKLGERGISGAGFALDGQTVAAQHSLVQFADTRVRIALDQQHEAGGTIDADSFFQRLVTSATATLTLEDGGSQPRAVLTFETGPVFAEARKALSAAQWSCEGAFPPPEPAATWAPETRIASALHSEYTEGGAVGDRRLQRGREGQAQHIAGLDRVNHPVIP